MFPRGGSGSRGHAAAAAAALVRPGGPDLTDSFITDLTTAIIKLTKSCEGTLSHSCSSDANMIVRGAR